MRVATEIIDLELKYPWKIAREAVVTSKPIVVVRVEHDGLIGLGEAQPSEYYHGETPSVVVETVSAAAPLLGNDPFLLEDVIDALTRVFPEAPATVAALDMALHDLVGKLLGVPLYRLFGLDPLQTPRTSYTLGIDTIPIVLRKLEDAREYPVLKLKVGFDGDLDLVKAVREHTDAAIRVDANTGWGVEEAIDRINALETYDIELIEQPIPPGNPEGLRTIREQTSMPIMADEDSVTSDDLPALAGCVDSINIKLMKCRGLREARRMIHVAHALGMKVMLGCMCESSLALTAAAHLSPLVEYADLDMNLLITNDPFQGVTLEEGYLRLPDGPGLGVADR